MNWREKTVNRTMSGTAPSVSAASSGGIVVQELADELLHAERHRLVVRLGARISGNHRSFQTGSMVIDATAARPGRTIGRAIAGCAARPRRRCGRPP